MLILKILLGFLGGMLFLGLLQRLNTNARRRLVVALTFLGGLFYILEFILPAGTHLPGTAALANPGTDNFLTPYVRVLGSVVLVIGGFAFGLGLLNLATVHGRNVLRRRPGWYNSAAFFVAMLLMAVSGLGRGDTGFHATLGTVNDVLFRGLYQPLGASVFAILAFYITTAAYRAFRIRSGESTLMMIAAFIVMMAQVPMGMALTNWLPQTGPLASLRIEAVSNWLMTILNMAALRAVGFGIGVGALAMSLRVWLSLEKGSYFGRDL